MKKTYMAPVTELNKVMTEGLLATFSGRKGAVDFGQDDDGGSAKRNDIFDLVEATNNERDNAWPDNYSAWDE